MYGTKNYTTNMTPTSTQEGTTGSSSGSDNEILDKPSETHVNCQCSEEEAMKRKDFEEQAEAEAEAERFLVQVEAVRKNQADVINSYKLDLLVVCKEARVRLDAVLQKFKSNEVCRAVERIDICGDKTLPHLTRQHRLVLNAIEDAIMRLGMCLKELNVTPNPYPNSYNPSSPVVDKTADGLIM